MDTYNITIASNSSNMNYREEMEQKVILSKKLDKIEYSGNFYYELVKTSEGDFYYNISFSFGHSYEDMKWAKFQYCDKELYLCGESYDAFRNFIGEDFYKHGLYHLACLIANCEMKYTLNQAIQFIETFRKMTRLY